MQEVQRCERRVNPLEADVSKSIKSVHIKKKKRKHRIMMKSVNNIRKTLSCE